MIKLHVTAKQAKLSLSLDDEDADSLSADSIIDKLNESGVCSGIIDDAIANALRTVTEHKQPVNDIVVAQQIDPEPGQAASKTLLIANSEIAAVGDTIAQFGAPLDGTDGMTILGAVIEAPQISDSRPRPGANTNSVHENEFKATIYGRVAATKNDISVVPLVQVSPDCLTAMIDVYAQSAIGTVITDEMLQESLVAADVVYGVDHDKIHTAIAQVAETAQPLLAVVVAEGRALVKGDDAGLEYLVETDQVIGRQREDGSIDFRERSTIRSVKTDVQICRLIPPTEGTPAIDVYGLRGATTPGRNINFAAGENVERRDGGFWSTADGAVMIRDNRVSVSDIFMVSGDIDLKTGNLTHEKGAVHITGTVRSGFEVRASSHIFVDWLVEDAILDSGADVEIYGGVLHADDGIIRAAGNVAAKFAQNAKIRAGQDIVIKGPATNCELYAVSNIVITGNKACLVGGIARAGGEIRVQQLGTEVGVPTRVEIDLDRAAIAALEEKTRRAEADISAGKGSEDELQALRAELRVLTDRRDKAGVIIVEDVVYPGVDVNIYGAHHRFHEPVHSCRISRGEDGEINIHHTHSADQE